MATLSYFWIKSIFIEQTKIDLLHNIDIFASQIENLDNIDYRSKQIKKITDLRVTVIDNDGVVIGESDKNKESMDNHLNRTEVLESKYNKFGSIVRHSDTLSKDLLYVSKKQHINGKDYYIRMARELEQIDESYMTLTIKVAFVFVIFIGIFFLVALKISKKVEFETNLILEFLNNLIKQNKSLKIESNYSLEFQKITKLLTKVSNSLSKKDKQKSKYTEKLKLSNRQKDDIISAISHEFKNPMEVLIGIGKIL